ncbi:hypothetical protein EYF80_067595 [Liparis tanakae]|uniref:Uncharacterized protein n=1 Tax=Liparis tanakae TaxID=230148 RepID=A0A4Z2E0H3_9TELE|nr:hypothetical protein EYF80_067595 [Liparis tanakae]
MEPRGHFEVSAAAERRVHGVRGLGVVRGGRGGSVEGGVCGGVSVEGEGSRFTPLKLAEHASRPAEGPRDKEPSATRERRRGAGIARFDGVGQSGRSREVLEGREDTNRQPWG